MRKSYKKILNPVFTFAYFHIDYHLNYRCFILLNEEKITTFDLKYNNRLDIINTSNFKKIIFPNLDYEEII